MKNPDKQDSFPSLSDDELKQLGRDIEAGIVFTNRHTRNPDEIQLVFIPLTFMRKKELEELYEKRPALIYEYMSQAAPRTCNDLPMFFSCRFLNQQDDDKLCQLIKAMREASDEAAERVLSSKQETNDQ